MRRPSRDAFSFAPAPGVKLTIEYNPPMFSERTNWRLAQNRFTQAVEEAIARGSKLLDLTAANPTRVGLEYDSAAILGALASQQALDYEPQAKGLLAARQAVAGYYCDRCVDAAGVITPNPSSSDLVKDEQDRIRVDPERIILTTSTSEGYSYVFRLLCNAGDELLVPKPSYPLFEFLADLQDVKLVPYPLIYDHGWQMDFHSMERAITSKTRGVVVVHPNNPTGSYVHEDEFAALNSLCRKHGLSLIVDEVFLDYDVAQRSNGKSALFGFTSPRASFSGNREVLTFTLSGLSKISALPQMKVSWIVTSGPEKIVTEAMERLEVIADTYLSMSTPMQWAVPTLLKQRRGVQRQLVDRVKINLADLDRALAEQKTCQRLHVEGGWYAVLRVPILRSDEDLAIDLVRQSSVLVHPGHFYDFPNDGYLVLSLIPKNDEFTEGIARVLQQFSS